MSKSTLYFIGAGPGAPDLITLRGICALARSKNVFLLDNYKETFAGELEGKGLYNPFHYLFDEMVALINRLFEEGDVSFLVPGDFTIFSPFQSIVSHFTDCIVIPGIGSLNAASALLKKTLDLPRISGSIIITSPRSISKTEFTKELSELIRKDSTLVLFMNNMPSAALKAELAKKYPLTTPVAVLYKISMPDEELIVTTIDNLPKEIDDGKYFSVGRLEPCYSIVVVGDIITASGSPEFWDWRKINIWDKREKTN